MRKPRISKPSKNANKSAGLGQVRIIGGRWRGRKTPVVDGPGLRPTADRAREILFNWLMYDLVGAKCLDLFAGTGVLGLECLSRGAKFVEFVELHRVAANQIEASLAVLLEDLPARSANVNCVNALNFLNLAHQESFDIVFLDPPFDSNLLQQAISLLDQRRATWLRDGTLVYLEFDRNVPSPRLPESWQTIKEKTVGQSKLLLVEVRRGEA